MKKVLHIIYDLSTAGAQTVVMNYLREMHNDPDYELIVAVRGSYEGKPYEIEAKEKNFPIRYCNYKEYKGFILFRPIINWINCQKAFYRVIKQENPDIIHSHLTYILPYICIPAFLSRKYCVHTLHSDPYAMPTRFKIWAIFAFHFLGFHAIGVTEAQAAKAVKRYHLKDISIVHNGLKIDRYKTSKWDIIGLREKIGIAQDAFVIGSVGRLSKIKNYPFLIKLFAKYHQHNHSSILMLVGEGECRAELELLVKDLGINDFVFFVGQQNDVIPYYKIMNLFMLTSFFESSSIVSVEAQLCGVRCVISDSIPESVVISNNVNRISLEEKQDVWINAIDDLLEKDKIENSFCSYSLDNTIKELKTVYNLLN